VSAELWPTDFRRAVTAAFGEKIDNKTYDVVNRRVEHALKVWRGRYAMTPEQSVYAWTLLTFSVKLGDNSARHYIEQGGVKSPWVYKRRVIAESLEGVVHNTAAHEGFKRRAGYINVLDQLKDMAS
jgi:hypothetical protein